MSKSKEKYGLFTAIAMIVGVCIGSGIFFKSDNILSATGGSISLGVIVFALAAISIVFGGLTISLLAQSTDKPGGVITYAEEFCGKKTACVFGWFQIFVYFPTITVIISWAVGIYTCILFNINLTLLNQMLIGLVAGFACFLYNALYSRFGGLIQRVSTIIKLIPLLLFAVCGIIFGDPIAGLKNVPVQEATGALWISAVGPIAYSFDGWIISTGISHEIRKSKKNLPIALIVAPLIVLAVYVLYFVGITSYAGADNVLALGDGHVTFAATQLLGSFFAKVVTVVVVISVFGTLNGVILGYIRIPYSLSLRIGMVPFENKLSKINEKADMPLNSAIFAAVICAFWWVIHFIMQNFNLLPNSDISEISIAVSYGMYAVLYIKVLKMNLTNHSKNYLRGVISPVLACVGSAFILYGTVATAGSARDLLIKVICAMICVAVMLVSLMYYSKKVKTI